MATTGTTIALLLILLATLVPAVSAADDLESRETLALKAAVRQVAPAVVRIESIGGMERAGEVLFGTGATTGLVVSEDGYIISSAFNFAQKPTSILVEVPGGAPLPARLVATDHSRMLVLLKVDTDRKLPVPAAAPEGAMRVGQWAVAVGRTFEAAEPNVSVGFVSALGRIWGKAIQTDAKVSPANYGGPLVDLGGRVMGVLVPLSPEAEDEVAGVEWYDSGIGFAVPLAHVLRILPKLKEGRDLFPGLLGINLREDVTGFLPPTLAACRANSPAYKAGLRTGDTIVELDGRKIERISQLRRELAGHYAGDKIQLAAMRGNERITGQLELAARLEPYGHPFLGILPLRPARGESGGLVVRYVYPESPAAKAGIQLGDSLVSLDGRALADRAAWLDALGALAVGQEVRIETQSGGKKSERTMRLAALPENLPAELPPAHPARKPSEGQRPATGVSSLAIPEFENRCLVYVPAGYDPATAHGVVLWLHSAGGFRDQELVDRWKPLCDRHDLVLVAPKAADPARWQPREVTFVRKVLEKVAATYTIDPARIVACGEQGGGTLAYLAAFRNRDLVRAVAAVDALLPAGTAPPDNEPDHPLAFYLAAAKKSPQARAMAAAVAGLREMQYPVAVKDLGDAARPLTTGELDELARWIDSLDRI
ncbi:MAG: PDZ domain-containing protein [Pirellulales bacterium]